jgi:hydroxymethylbilane synthase
VKPVRLGTRRSKLALAQAEEVRARLSAHGIRCTIVPMSTSGDRGASSDGTPGGLKTLFVDTIVESLEEGTIDAAVHSAKDLPAEDDEALVIAAVPPRADPHDVMVLGNGSLPPGGVIGTSSIRRRAQLLRAFPGVRLVDLRGNVDTRLRLLDEGRVNALVLAAAGLHRLGIEREHSQTLDLDKMVPAPGQGALAVQARADDESTLEALAQLDHRESRVALDAERSLTWRVGGGCDVPLGAYAHALDEAVTLVAVVATPGGERTARAEVRSDSAEGAAAEAARALLAEGAEEILEKISRPA